MVSTTYYTGVAEALEGNWKHISDKIHAQSWCNSRSDSVIEHMLYCREIEAA